MGIDKILLILSVVISTSFYIYELYFCYVTGIPVVLVQFDIIRAFIVSVSGAIFVALAYSLGHLFSLIFVMPFVLGSKKFNRKVSEIYDLLPIALFSLFFFFFKKDKVENIDNFIGAPLTSLVTSLTSYVSIVFSLYIFVLSVLLIGHIIARKIRLITKKRHGAFILSIKLISDRRQMFLLLIILAIPLYIHTLIELSSSNSEKILNDKKIVRIDGLELQLIRIYNGIFVYKNNENKIYISNGLEKAVEIYTEKTIKK